MTTDEAMKIAERVAAIWDRQPMETTTARELVEALLPYEADEINANLSMLRDSTKFRPTIAEICDNVGGATSWEAQTAARQMQSMDTFRWSGHDPKDFPERFPDA